MQINIIDGWDPAILKATSLLPVGENIVLNGMCNGVSAMVSAVLMRCGDGKKISKLRIMSHGAQGIIGISMGNGVYPKYNSLDLASIDLANFDQESSELDRLKGHFTRFGEVVLLGCSVGGGRNGKILVKKLADLWGVRVTAGVFVQFFGGPKNTSTIEGPTVTAFPGLPFPIMNPFRLPLRSQIMAYEGHGGVKALIDDLSWW